MSTQTAKAGKRASKRTKKVRFQVSIHEGLHTRLKQAAEMRDLDVSTLVSVIFDEACKRDGV